MRQFYSRLADTGSLAPVAPQDTLHLMKALLAGLAMLLLTLHPVAAEDTTPPPGPIVGIGVAVKMVDQHPVIDQVVPRNPADKAGLKVGDRIVKIDGTSVDGLSLAQIAEHLRGASGSRVRVTIHRGGGQRTYIVKRQIIVLLPSDSQSYPQ
jgi:C-terminal processing protease CtpA/Prc